MNDIRLSIIITAYNQEKCIARCLDSLLCQLKDGVEVLVIDDGSEDRSGAIIQKYNQVQYIYKENGGVSSARNLGLQKAKGKNITFIDGDDCVTENYIDTIMQLIGAHTDDLIVFDYNEGCLSLTDKTIQLSNNEGFCHYLDQTYQFWIKTFVWNKIFKKDLIDRFNIEFDTNKRVGEDTLFCSEYVLHCRSIVTVSASLYNYGFISNTNSKYNTIFLEESKSYFSSFRKIANKNNIKLDEHYLETFYLSRWFGQILNSVALKDYKKGYNEIKEYLDYNEFKHIHFFKLSFKYKMYFILIKLHLTRLIYSILFIKG